MLRALQPQNGMRLQPAQSPERCCVSTENSGLTERKDANQHARIRNDHATERAEDYVEAVASICEQKGRCRVADLAREFDVSHVTVTRTISRLQRDGYVVTEPYRPIQLTAKGRRLAKKSRERHEIVHHFLLAIGVSEEIARQDSEGIEHHVSNETLKVMKQFIDSAESTS